MIEAVQAIQSSIEIVGKLRELARKAGDADFLLHLADLSNDLADAKMNAAALKTDVARLQEENAHLRRQLEEREAGKPHLEQGIYRFPSDDGNYCTACFDVRRQKVRVSELTGHFRDLAHWMCPACKATYD